MARASAGTPLPQKSSTLNPTIEARQPFLKRKSYQFNFINQLDNSIGWLIM
jgi:hypothetical protein